MERQRSLLSITDTSWKDKGSCLGIDREVFFPKTDSDAGPAKLVCANCVVREPCLEYALTSGEKYGVWGGFTENERRRLQIDCKSAARTA